jgi:hypothetical protein
MSDKLEHATDTAKSACNGLLDDIIERRDQYQRLIDKGKGIWPQDNYVRDDTWTAWNAKLSELNSILRNNVF